MRPVWHQVAASDPHILAECAFTPGVACVDGSARFDEHQFDLMFRVGFVLDTFRDHEHLPGRKLNRAVAKIDPQYSVRHDERLIRLVVGMPDPSVVLRE